MSSEPRRRRPVTLVVGGKDLFSEWIEGLGDAAGRAAIKRRIDRLEEGNLGDSRPVGGGVWELRIHSGPGYRVYFAAAAESIILILCGGDKGTQHRDIRRAQELWRLCRKDH